MLSRYTGSGRAVVLIGKTRYSRCSCGRLFIPDGCAEERSSVNSNLLSKARCQIKTVLRRLSFDSSVYVHAKSFLISPDFFSATNYWLYFLKCIVAINCFYVQHHTTNGNNDNFPGNEQAHKIERTVIFSNRAFTHPHRRRQQRYLERHLSIESSYRATTAWWEWNPCSFPRSTCPARQSHHRTLAWQSDRRGRDC